MTQRREGAKGQAKFASGNESPFGERAGLVKYLTSLQRFAALLLKVALDEVFDFAEDHFHHHRLRAGPTTPETAKGGGENQNAREEDEHCDGEDDAVLRLEDLAENGEAALDDIDQEERGAVDANPRAREHDNDGQPTCR